MFRNVFTGCVSDRNSQTEVFRSQKLKFGASLSSALKHGYLPDPLVEILVYIAKEGIRTADVFRRPGNPNDTRRIVKWLTEGKQVVYANYSFYTLASVVKKFLLKIPGGVFTTEGEEQLLQVLTLDQKIEQIEAVHSFMETLTPAHQKLIALLFGTWYRIVTYQAQNCMSVEALSRSVAGSMFHTCAEDPAKVEKASRIMQFLIDNYSVESMFGHDNIRFFSETTHTGIHIPEFYQHSYVPDTQPSPLRTDFIEVVRLETEETEQENQGLGSDRECSESPPPALLRCSRDSKGSNESQLMINTSTLSAPEVSLVPSPEVSKRPKSLEDSLNEVRSHYQNRCISRFNSVKRKQLERLRQRSDWFLSPLVRERNNSRKGKTELWLSLYSNNNTRSSSPHYRGNGNSNCQNSNGNNNHIMNNRVLQQKNSGNSTVTKASSENAVAETFSDGDSVFTDNTSRSESPASEPVWSHTQKICSQNVVHSDTIAEFVPADLNLNEMGSSADLSLGSFCSASGHLVELSPLFVRSNVFDEEEEVEAKENVEEEDDDDDSTTPAEVQEEDNTLMASSIPDLQAQSITEDRFMLSQDSDKDVAVDTFNEGLTDVQLKMLQDVGQTCDLRTVESTEDEIQGQQHPTQEILYNLDQGAEVADTNVLMEAGGSVEKIGVLEQGAEQGDKMVLTEEGVKGSLNSVLEYCCEGASTDS